PAAAGHGRAGVTDGQELPVSQGGLDDAAEGEELLLAAWRPDELQGGGQAGRAAGDRQNQGGQPGQVGRRGQDGGRHALADQRRRADEGGQGQDLVPGQGGAEPVAQVLPGPVRVGGRLGGDRGGLLHVVPDAGGEPVKPREQV